jgi:hypothetical protein
MHRLGEEVLGPGGEAEHHGIAIVKGGDHDDGDGLGSQIALDPAGDLVPVHSGHHDVEQDEVGRLRGHRGDCFFAARRAEQDVAFRREHDFQQLPVGPFIVDDQNPRRVVAEVGFHARTSCSATVLRNS